MTVRRVLDYSIAFVSLLIVGCSSQQATDIPSTPSPMGFHLSMLPESTLDQGKLTMEICELDDGKILVKIKANNASNLKQAMFKLEYDSSRYSASAIQSADDLRLCGFTGQVLRLDVLDYANEIHHGIISLDPEGGFSGSGTIASVLFTKASVNGELKQINNAPVNEESRPQISFDTETDEIHWWHNLLGDYDQNGVVGIPDMTPIGQRYGTDQPYLDTSADYMIDGNRDGVIDIHDITTIGANFGNSIACGFDLFKGGPADYPENGISQAGNYPVQNIPLSKAIGSPGKQRLSYSYSPDNMEPGQYYWIRGRNQRLEHGIASNPIRNWQPAYDFGMDRMKTLSLSDIIYDSSGNMHVLYNKSPNTITYAKWDGAWNTSHFSIDADRAWSKYLVLDHANNPLVYCRVDNNYNRSSYIAIKQGEDWQIDEVPDSKTTRNNHKIAIDSSNTIHMIATYDADDKLVYYKKSNDEWESNVIYNGSTGYDLDIALDSNDRPLVAFSDNDIKTVYLATLNDGDWQTDIIDTVDNYIYYIILAIGTTDNPHVVYDYNYTINYAVNIDDNWQISQVTESGMTSVNGLCFILDKDNSPHVTFYENCQNKYFHYSIFANKWENTVITPSYFSTFDKMVVTPEKIYVFINGYLERPSALFY